VITAAAMAIPVAADLPLPLAAVKLTVVLYYLALRTSKNIIIALA
jgi:hypothetical protein